MKRITISIQGLRKNRSQVTHNVLLRRKRDLPHSFSGATLFQSQFSTIKSTGLCKSDLITKPHESGLQKFPFRKKHFSNLFVSGNNMMEFCNDKTKSSPLKKHERNTYKLLDREIYPIGSFTQGTIREIIATLRDWSSVHQSQIGTGFFDESIENVSNDNSNPQDTAEKAFQLLERVLIEEKENWKELYPNSKAWVVTPEMYELTIKAMKWGNESSIYKSISLLDKMESIQEMFMDDESCFAHILYCYIHILHAITKSSNWKQNLSQVGIEILDRMKTQHKALKYNDPNLATMALNTELNLYAMMGDGNKASEIFHSAQALELIGKNEIIDSATYGTLMKAWIQFSKNSSDTSNKEKAGQRCEQLLFEMNEIGKTRIGLKPDTFCFTSAIRAWAICDGPGSANKAYKILKWMEESFQNDKNQNAKPNDYTYNSAIYAFAHNMEDGGADKAEELLLRMIELYGKGEIDVKPDILSFNSVLRGWTLSRNNPECGNRAEAVLNLMDHLYEKGNISVKPDSLSYNSVIQAHSNSGKHDALERIENICSKMRLFNEENEEKLNLSRIGYTSLIRALVRNGQKGDLIEAERYINTMECIYNEGDASMKPEPFVYEMVCNAYAKEGNFEKAFEIFQRRLSLFENGDMDMRPSVFSYTNILNALANSKERDAPVRAQNILDSIISSRHHCSENDHIKTKLFNAVMKVWLKSNDRKAADKVLQLLQEMEDLYQEGYKDVKPDLVTYNTVISTLARNRQPGSAYKAEAILDVMREMSNEEGSELGPDTVTYSSVIHALSLCGEPGSAEKAEDLLVRMEEEFRKGNERVKPNTHTFTSVITAHTSKRTPGSAERAEKILKRMEETQGLEPSKVTYTAVIDAWTKSGDKKAWGRAKKILERMRKQSELGNTHLKPNVVTYSSVLTALAQSREKRKARKALNMLREMTKNEIAKPNLYTYNAVLSSAAYTKGSPDERNEALHIAVMILEEALNQAKDYERTEVTYGLFFAACRNLSYENPHRVEKLVDEVFSRCCEDGRVDYKILTQVRRVATPSVMRKYFGERNDFNELQLNECPTFWSRNVTQKTNRRKYFSPKVSN